MVALFHRKHETEAPTAKACTSHAIYTVVTDDTELNVCGPHTYMLMGQVIGEHPHYKAEDPEPGTRCDYVEVSW